MFHDLNPYPQARSDDLPVGWQRKRLRSIATMLASNVDKKESDDEIAVRLCNYVDVYRNAVITPDLEFMRATATADEVRRFRLRRGDVVITKDSESWTDIGVPALVASEAEDLVYGYHLAVLRPGPYVLGAYLYLAMTTPVVASQFHVAANGVTRFGLGHGAIKATVVPVPPIEEQKAIVTYLAHAHQRINQAIATKRRLVGLLEQARRLAVESAFGDLSAAVFTRLKYVATIQAGLTLGKDYGGVETRSYPYLRVANVQAGALALDKITEVEVPPSEAARRTLQKGDLLMTEGGDIDKLGRGTIWTGVIDGCLHQNHIFAVRCSDAVDPRFLEAYLRHSAARTYFYTTAKKTTNLAATNSTTLGNLAIPSLSRSAQDAVVNEIVRRTCRVDRQIAAVQREVELLEEFRTRLTADVVTGQLDVRDAAKELQSIDPVGVFAVSSATQNREDEDDGAYGEQEDE